MLNYIDKSLILPLLSRIDKFSTRRHVLFNALTKTSVHLKQIVYYPFLTQSTNLLNDKLYEATTTFRYAKDIRNYFARTDRLLREDVFALRANDGHTYCK